jgi:hypothetical protein
VAQGPGGVTPTPSDLRQAIGLYRHDAGRAVQRKCLQPGWPSYQYPSVRAIPREKLRAILRVWQERARWARSQPGRCGELRFRPLWLCIHRREGAWADPNDPYFGGLQMGRWFMGTYGDRNTYGRDIYRVEGTANHWTAREQMGVAEAAYREERRRSSWLRSQWPNTAPPCMEHAAP